MRDYERETYEKVMSFRKKKKWWNTSDLALFLEIPVHRVWRLINRGEIAAYKVGKEWRIEVEEVIKFLIKIGNQ